MTRTILLFLFALILLSMLAVTTYASLDRSILNVRPEVLNDPWFHATLADTYFGFITFYVWVFYKEPSILRRAVWFVAIMLLGNIAMAVYMLIQVWQWQPERGVESLILRHQGAVAST